MQYIGLLDVVVTFYLESFEWLNIYKSILKGCIDTTVAGRSFSLQWWRLNNIVKLKTQFKVLYCSVFSFFSILLIFVFVQKMFIDILQTAQL